MTRRTYQPIKYEAFIGLDVDKNSFSYTITDHFQTSRSKKMPSNPEHLYNYMQKHFDLNTII